MILLRRLAKCLSPALPSLGAASALLLLVAAAGCSSSSNNPGGPGSGDSGTTADGASPDGGTDPTLKCPPDLSGFKPEKSNPPNPRRAACTDADVTKLMADCLNSADRWEDPACTGHTDDCFKCMLTSSTDASWGPIVKFDDGSGLVGWVNNEYGCIDLVTGQPGCGDALLASTDCVDVACPNARCTVPADLDACRARAAAKDCTPYAASAACKAAAASAAPCVTGTRDEKFKTLMKTFCQAK